MTDGRIYFDDNHPARSQYRTRRAVPPWAQRRTVTAIVVHTAENDLDDLGPDSGAENVARFIANRTDAAGSYHSIVDSDSTVRLGRYDWEMFHEGTGGNGWSLGLSFACNADSWPTALHHSSWHSAALRGGVIEAVDMIRWVHETYKVAVPARRITAEEYRAGVPGFISHAALDPGRRSDPGDRFPWNAFLDGIHSQLGHDDDGETPMPTDTLVADWQRLLVASGYNIGTSGPTGDGIDDKFGPKTLAASIEVQRIAHTAVIALEDAALGARTRDVIDLYRNQQGDAPSD